MYYDVINICAQTGHALELSKLRTEFDNKCNPATDLNVNDYFYAYDKK